MTPSPSKEHGMVAIKDLWGLDRFVKSGGKVVPERHALLGYFSEKSGIPLGHVIFMVGHLKQLKDLYYIKSDCDQAHARGVNWAAAFRKALSTKK